MERPGRLLSTLALVVAVIGHAGLAGGGADAGASSGPSTSPSTPKVGSVVARLPLPAPVPETATGPLPGEGTTVVATTVDPAGRPTFHPITGATLEQAQELAAQVEGAVSVEVDPVVRIASDPHRSLQWGHDALGVDTLPAGGEGVVVAVIDSGIAAGHEDLAGQVLCSLGADYVGDGASTDGCADPNGHGTHVAGIVAAIAGNGRGIAGTAPAVKVLPVRALDRNGAGYASHVAAGIVHAVDKGAHVINLSLSGDLSSTQQSAVDYAVARNVVVVAAAGNNRETGNAIQYPAAFPAVLSVAAMTKDRVSASFSYSGPTVDVTAPGVSIASTLHDGRYGYKSGTSMAAPAVAALAARYRSARPGATQSEVVAALTSSARDLEAPGRDNNTGTGLVDLAAALAATAAPVAPAAPAAPAAPVATPSDSAVSVSWSAVTASAAAPVTGYRLYRDNVLLLQTPGLGHLDTAVANGTSYAYSVSAYGDGGESARSATVSATPLAPPTAPAALVAGAGDARVSLSWQPSTGHGLLGYRVYRNGLHHLTSTTTSATDDVGVVNGTTYAYTVRAYGAGGESTDSTVALATPVAPPAPAPAPAAPAPSGGGGTGGFELTAPAPAPRPTTSPISSPVPQSPSPAPSPSSPGPEALAPLPAPETAPEEPATAPAPLVEFADALASVHAASIGKVARAGITTGYPDGTFRPDEHVTRGQMATFLVRALGLEPLPGTRFADSAGSAHEAAINAVAAAGITVGDGRGGFAPAAPVTRGQLATFLTRALTLPPSEVGAFSDIAGHAHESAIRAVAAAGIAQGDSSGRFVPEARVTRAQMATFLARALHL